MKKTVIRIVALSIAVMMLAAMFVACGTISGTYTNEVLGVETTYEFSGKNVTVSYSAFGVSASAEGTYEIEKTDDGKTITFTFEDDGAALFNGTLPFEKTDDGIKIGDVEYKKQ